MTPKSTPDATVERKVAHLAEPRSYPHAPGAVEVHESHMSWVFLAGPLVYKMKKPVRYDFLDFGTLEKRAHFVAEELRLNRRLAPSVYRRAARLTVDWAGTLELDGSGRTVEWLVEMHRLPQQRMLESALRAGRAGPEDVAAVGRRLVAFYAGLTAERMPPGAYPGRLERELEITAGVLSDPRFCFDGEAVARALADASAALERARPVLQSRAQSGFVVEGHGDLRPEHVCLGDPPVVIDCLEFNRQLRLVDPFDEIVFLGVESARLGGDWVLPVLLRELSDGLGNEPPVDLLRFFWRYRALLRARLSLLHLVEPVVRQPDKWRPQARRYLALADEAGIRFRSPGAR